MGSCLFQLNQDVIYQGIKRKIYDIDYGYKILALDGNKYISPNHPENFCIEALMDECELITPD